MAKTKAQLGEAQITGDKKCRRTIRIYGVEGLVLITLRSEGLEIKAKGSHMALTSSWAEVIAAMNVPERAPAKFYSDPMGLLKDKGSKQHRKITKKRNAKLLKVLTAEIVAKESQ